VAYSDRMHATDAGSLGFEFWSVHTEYLKNSNCNLSSFVLSSALMDGCNGKLHILVLPLPANSVAFTTNVVMWHPTQAKSGP